MNKVLIVTYYWPPSGGAGVQRWLKFSKYLPEFGWEPVILTVDPAYAAYPVVDNSLTNDLTSSLKVYKTPAVDYFSIYKKDKSKIPAAGFANSVDNTLKNKMMRFIRGNFFIPDPRRGWNKYAFKKACEIIVAEGIKHVITTSPPHSTQLIGLKIKTKYPEIKWIADLRDPWTDIYYYQQFYPTFLSKFIDSFLEKRILNRSDSIITVGTSLKTSFSLKVKGINNKINIITNGYDEDDFSGQISQSPSRYTISYIGTLSDVYPINGFLDALDIFRKNGNDYILRFIGTVSQKQKDLVISKIGNPSVEFIPYVDHSKSIQYLLSTTVLLLIIPDHPGNKCIITGKIFEYIASGKPICCLGPRDGDASIILTKNSFGKCFSYNDINDIESYLRSIKTRPFNIENPAESFSHRNIVKKLVSFL
jgi:glycosyltransferase involved in cell wall biosynthesis